MIEYPTWIDTKLFQESLQKHFSDENLQVNSFAVKPALAAGENYTSDLYRVAVDYTNGKEVQDKMSLIVKLVPDTGFKSEIAEELFIFEKEMRIYRDVLPRINKKLKDSPALSASCLFAETSPHTVIIMEDLSPLGFVTANRQDGFDLKHCLLIVESLAKLHAGSLFVNRESPDDFKFYDFSLFNDQHGKDFVEKWITNSLKGLIAAIQKWPGYEKYTTKLQKLLPTVVERAVAITKKDPNGFNVLCHGDTWINNMLFKYSNGVPIEMKFVDFQMCIFSTPVLDLLYFLFTSPQEDVRINHMDHILRHYHEQLLRTVVQLNGKPEEFNVPTFEELMVDFKAHGFHGVVASIVVTPIVRAPPKEGASLEAVIANDGESEYVDFMFNTPQYKATMANLLPYFDKNGWLD